MNTTTILVGTVVSGFIAAVGYQFIPGTLRTETASLFTASTPTTATPVPGPIRAAAEVDRAPARTGSLVAPAPVPQTRTTATTAPVPANRAATAAAPAQRGTVRTAQATPGQPAATPAPTPPAAATPPAETPAATTPSAAAAGLKGDFRGANSSHKGSGSVEIVKTDKGFEAKLSKFSTTPGPDLEIWLVAHADPKKEADVTKSKYVSLGRLKSFNGDQTYQLPAGVDPAAFKSVVIWCEDFSVLFASAPLKPKS